MIPNVSVIIPTYNRAPFIERAIHSVLQQTYNDLEVIVVDDASTDDTWDRVAALQNVDHRVCYIRHKTNQGAQVARNAGIQAARGEYIAFLDSDDEWLPQKLERQMAVFLKGADPLGVVYCDMEMVYQNKRTTKEWRPHYRGAIYSKILCGWSAGTSTFVIKRDYLEKVGGFDENIHAYQEWDLCIRLARICEFDYVPEVMVLYHQHDLPTISKDNLRGAWGFLNIVEKHRTEIMHECDTMALSKHYQSVGRLFIRAGRLDMAKRLFLKSIQASPKNYRAILSLGGTLFGIKGFEFILSLKNSWTENQLKSRKRNIVS